jgi:uncharacterized hydrophobic protein (TIGR00271 family)
MNLTNFDTARLRALDVDAAGILVAVERDGTLNGRFLFLTLASCVIATLGVLLNSPAVVIGSMLVAPLLGPIIRMGFAFVGRDIAGTLRGLGTAIVGITAALVAAMLIIHLAPDNGPTTEILSRTRPGLLDFLVAICAGPAVGYAVIRGQSAVFAGVAIATALMPPIVVCGYGLASGDFAIAQGAALLLVANVAGLAAGVGAVAVWHGMYATRLLPLKMLAVTAMLAGVAVPLVLAKGLFQ